MTRLLTGQVPRREVTPALAAAVRRPETVASAGDLADAARLLGDLGAVAVATETVEPRRAAGIDTRTMAKKVIYIRAWLERRQRSGPEVVLPMLPLIRAAATGRVYPDAVNKNITCAYA